MLLPKTLCAIEISPLVSFLKACVAWFDMASVSLNSVSTLGRCMSFFVTLNGKPFQTLIAICGLMYFGLGAAAFAGQSAEAEAHELREKALEEDVDWASTAKRLESMGGECSGSWQILWSLGKTGNKNALAEIAASIPWAGLVPPGYPIEYESVTRLRLLFSVYSMPNSTQHYPSVFSSAVKILGREREDSAEIASVHDCLSTVSSEQDADRCISLAVQNDLIPSFEQFVDEVDARAMDDPDAVARCFAIENSQREMKRKQGLPKD